MKIKMDRRPTLKEWAERNNVSMQVAQLYERARKNWLRSANRYGRKYGLTEGFGEGLGLKDIRTLEFNRSYPDLESFIEAKALSQINKNKYAREFIVNAQREYLENLLLLGRESADYDALEWDRLELILQYGKEEDIAHLVDELGGNAIKMIYVSKEDQKDALDRGEPVIDHDFSHVYKILNAFGGFSNALRKRLRDN